MVSPPFSTHKRIILIDVLRGVAVLLVLALHLGAVHPYPSTVFNSIWISLSQNGFFGVNIFFLISGFLISRSIDLKAGGLFSIQLRKFFLCRIARIYPLLFFILTLGLIISVFRMGAGKGITKFIWFKPLKGNEAFWFSQLTFTFNWYRMIRFNGNGLFWDVLWSLSVEEQFYLFFPLMLLFTTKLKNLTRMLCSVVLLGLVSRAFFSYQFSPNRFFTTMSSFSCFDQIAMGILLYLIYTRSNWVSKRSPNELRLICLAGLAVAIRVYLIPDKNLSVPARIFAPTVMNFGIFLFLLGGMNLPLFKNRSFYLLAWIGKLSYGIYLFHSLVLLFLYKGLNMNNSNPFLVLLLAILFTTTLAAISYYFFEIPTQRWFLNRMLERQSRAEEFHIHDSHLALSFEANSLSRLSKFKLGNLGFSRPVN